MQRLVFIILPGSVIVETLFALIETLWFPLRFVTFTLRHVPLCLMQAAIQCCSAEGGGRRGI